MSRFCNSRLRGDTIGAAARWHSRGYTYLILFPMQPQHNPFDSPEARRHASYAHLSDGRVETTGEAREDRARRNERAFDKVKTFIGDGPYPCVAAQAALNQESIRLGTYGELGEADSTAGLARDLFTFTSELTTSQSDFLSFLALFASPVDMNEPCFEQLLWRQLAQLHRLDRRHHDWNPDVSSDTQDPNFAFSFAGRAFYVIGMHPQSSRLARRFERPMLVFNAHSQFQSLRADETYDTMKQVVRERDRELQGSINPMLQDFGEASEARQYSGRAVDSEWQCPFHDSFASE